MYKNVIKIVGGGLAGCEAAYQLAKRGYQVHLYEMRPQQSSPAHHSAHLAELVCSNSLKSSRLDHASGLLKQEMRLLDSLFMQAADQSSVPAGQALAVDRLVFSAFIEEKLAQFPNLTIIREEVSYVEDVSPTILATGPLTSDALAHYLAAVMGEEHLYFYDAAAPIVLKETIDFSKVYFKSRYEEAGSQDYINCPFTKEEYLLFHQELMNAKRAQLKAFEKEVYFEGCMPVEVLAKRGYKTLTFGALKPVGLEKADGTRPYAVVQLRQDNQSGHLYNLVGFQTNLTFKEQQRVFRMIPGLEQVEFVRYGVMHRNTYIDSPRQLNPALNLKAASHVFIAGQLSGVEGYVESAAMGLLVAFNVIRHIKGQTAAIAPKTTIMGSLQRCICDASIKNFQPMNANYGIVANKEKDRKILAVTSCEDIVRWYDELAL